MFIVGEFLLDDFISDGDILRVAGERRPAKGAFAFAEEGADIGRNKTGEVEGVFQTMFLCLATQVVAVIEHNRSGLLQINHRLAMLNHRIIGTVDVFVRIRSAQRQCLLIGDAVGYVAI